MRLTSFFHHVKNSVWKTGEDQRDKEKSVLWLSRIMEEWDFKYGKPNAAECGIANLCSSIQNL